MKKLPRVGERYRLKIGVDRYPHFTVDAGMQGTITKVLFGAERDLQGLYNDAPEIHMHMDEFIDGAEEWDNHLIWQDCWLDLSGAPISPLTVFHGDCELI